jgi:DNA invertase Pin-like site-specific DNA recombinase
MPRPPDPDRRDPHDLAGLRAANYYRVSNDGAGQEKSVRDQRYEGRAWAERAGVEVVIEAEDAGLSASEFARKERPGYRRLLSVIEAGRVDLLWVWALNRATRQAREYLDLAELCRAQGVRWVVGGRVYDLEDDDATRSAWTSTT